MSSDFPRQEQKVDNASSRVDDQHITDNEKDYYLSKIISNKGKLTKYLACGILVTIIDLALCYFYPEQVSLIHQIAVIVFLFSNVLSLFIFRINLEDINSGTYKKTVFMVYFLITIIIYFYGCLFHFCLTKIIFKWTEVKEIYTNANLINKISFISVAIMTLLFNLVIPLCIISKSIKFKKKINSYGNIIGQEYSVTYHVSVPTLDISSGNIQMDDKSSNPK